MEMNDIKKRWIEYSKEIFRARRKELLKTFNTGGLFITKDEIKNAINHLKQNKAPDSDNIHTEMLKAFDNKAIEELSKMFNLLYMIRHASLKSYVCSSIFINISKGPKQLNAMNTVK